MSQHGLEVIDRSAQKVHEWVGELDGRLDYGSRASALRLLRTVLHLVRDHLLIDELAQLSAQLPLLIRGMFFEGWVPKHTPIRDRSVEGFTKVVDATMKTTSEYRGSQDIRTVFELLNARLTAGEVDDVRKSLPENIRALWPTP